MGNNYTVQSPPLSPTGRNNIAALLPHDGEDQFTQYQEIRFSEKDLKCINSKEQDDAYGEIQIYKVKNIVISILSEGIEEPFQVCKKNKILDSQEDCNEYQRKVNLKKQLKHPNLIHLLKCLNGMNNNLCSSIYKIDLIYEYAHHNLQIEMLDRFQSKNYIEEKSIFDLIEQVMSALDYLKSKGIWHGDIQPKTILIDFNSLFKITDIQFMTSGMCGYRKHLAGIETECFLAPELLPFLKKQSLFTEEEIDLERADVFSLGLVGLAMSTLQSVEGVYNFDKYTLNEGELGNLLKIVQSKYSNNLYLLLVSMLNSVDRRVDFDTGLDLIDQMRSGKFNQQEYEAKRFESTLGIYQQKLDNSLKNQQFLSENSLKNSRNISNFNSNQRVSQNLQQTQSNAPHMNPYDSSKSYEAELEKIKRAHQQIVHDISQQPFVPSPKQRQPQHEQLKYSNGQNPINNISSPTNSYQKRSFPKQKIIHFSGNSSPRMIESPQQFQASQIIKDKSQPISIPAVHKVNINQISYPPHNKNQQIILGKTYLISFIDFKRENYLNIDDRVKQSSERSQLPKKIQNSSLRLFRDQLLSDELYIPKVPFQNVQHQISKNGSNKNLKQSSSNKTAQSYQ